MRIYKKSKLPMVYLQYVHRHRLVPLFKHLYSRRQSSLTCIGRELNHRSLQHRTTITRCSNNSWYDHVQNDKEIVNFIQNTSTITRRPKVFFFVFLVHSLIQRLSILLFIITYIQNTILEVSAWLNSFLGVRKLPKMLSWFPYRHGNVFQHIGTGVLELFSCPEMLHF